MIAEVFYFGYNAFLVKCHDKTLVIDPGRNLSWFRTGTLIPRERWPDIDLILVTHAHPDHGHYALEMSKVAGANIVCGEDFKRFCRGKSVDPVVLRPGANFQSQGIDIFAIPVQHGPAVLSFLSRWFRFPLLAAGSIGYLIDIQGFKILTLGDTMPLDSWGPLKPHVFLAPIGGKVTLSAEEALEAAKTFDAEYVIPCHYDCPLWFFKKLLPADPHEFARRVAQSGRKAVVLKENESFTLKI